MCHQGSCQVCILHPTKPAEVKRSPPHTARPFRSHFSFIILFPDGGTPRVLVLPRSFARGGPSPTTATTIRSPDNNSIKFYSFFFSLFHTKPSSSFFEFFFSILAHKNSVQKKLLRARLIWWSKLSSVHAKKFDKKL